MIGAAVYKNGDGWDIEVLKDTTVFFRYSDSNKVLFKTEEEAFNYGSILVEKYNKLSNEELNQLIADYQGIKTPNWSKDVANNNFIQPELVAKHILSTPRFKEELKQELKQTVVSGYDKMERLINIQLIANGVLLGLLVILITVVLVKGTKKSGGKKSDV